MPDFETMIAVTIAGLLLSASPGPSMLYVLSRSVGQSRGAGLASTFGLAIGGVLLAVASAMGLAAVIRHSSTLYMGIQIAGAAYLFYLGWMLIREAGQEEMAVKTVVRQSHWQIMWQGVWVEVLNPKTALFFLAFIPQFVDEQRADVTAQLLWLGVLVPLTAIPSDVIVSIGGGALAEKLKGKQRVGKWLGWLSGLVLMMLAVRLLV